MKKTILSSLLVVAAVAPIASHAADGTITFNGKITSQTCTINGGVPNIPVSLPTVSTSALSAAGETAGAVTDSIKINLTACSPASGKVHAFFENGPTVDLTTHNLRNATGTATNVQVGITDGVTNANIAIGAADGEQGASGVTISAAGTANLVYGTKYVATAPVAAGSVITTVQYTISPN